MGSPTTGRVAQDRSGGHSQATLQAYHGTGAAPDRLVRPTIGWTTPHSRAWLDVRFSPAPAQFQEFPLWPPAPPFRRRFRGFGREVLGRSASYDRPSPFLILHLTWSFLQPIDRCLLAAVHQPSFSTPDCARQRWTPRSIASSSRALPPVIDPSPNNAPIQWQPPCFGSTSTTGICFDG